LLGPMVLYYYRDRREIIRFLGIGFIMMVLVTIPIWLGVNFSNLGESIDLYFRKFEFNASVYYLMRELGYWFTGYNEIQYIGPFLALCTIGSILYFSSRVEKGNLLSFIKYAGFSYIIYLLLATTVHPWYLIPLVLFSVFYRMNAVLLWSFLITLSYFTYSQEKWQESNYVLFIEYGLFLAALLMERRKR